VDASALTGYGISQGGYWITRAVAVDLLPGEKEIIEFGQAQGANFHCQPTGRQLTHTQMLDWLAEHLPPRQA
jgi:hypothetical protein